MEVEELNLEMFRQPLEKVLTVYSSLYKELSFGDFPDLYPTPDKPNSARTVIPIRYGSENVGDMYAIVFLHGDGTGDNSKQYNLGNVIIPEEFKHEKMPERVIPRPKKTDKEFIIAEGFFPLFSINNIGHIAEFSTHLDELILDSDNRVIRGYQLGQNETEYLQSINSRKIIKPKIELTVGYDKDNNRVGDPHAIYRSLYAEGAIQFGGFIGVKDSANPLLENVLMKCSLPKAA